MMQISTQQKKGPKVLESTNPGCIFLKGNFINTIATILGLSALVVATTAKAEGDLSRADVIDVVIEMGSNADGMFFSPDNYAFVTGQAYRFILTNVDEIKHEIALNEMVNGYSLVRSKHPILTEIL